jgi:hypothetical protein
VLVVALVLAVLITVPVGLWLVAVQRDHPRDPAAFIYNLDHGMTSNGHSTFAPVPDDFLITEGDRSCAWLRDQPYPLWRRGERFSRGGMISRYRHTYPMSKRVWRQENLRPGLRYVVVDRAWQYLCGDAYAMRKPHNPFNRPAERD